MKNEWNSEYTKTQATGSVQNISFLFIERAFSTEKNTFFFLKFSKKRK